MLDMLNMEKGPFQVLFGDDASADPRIVLPVVLVVFVVLIIIALRITFSDKGKSEMTQEELERDRKILDEPMARHAEMMGEKYDIERVRAIEAREIAEAKRRRGIK